MAARSQRPRTDAPLQLQGKGHSGDVVHKYQEMGTAQGFRNVSGKWLDKCKSFDAVTKLVTEGKAEIEDFRVPFKAMTPRLNDQGHFVMAYEGRDFRPTSFAMEHIAKQAGVSTYDVEVLTGARTDRNDRQRDRPQDREALMSLLTAGFGIIDPNKEFLFRTQKDGTLRAWLSKEYLIMDNLAFLEILNEIIPGGLYSHWKDDGDKSTMWGNVLIPDSIRQEEDSEYGGLFAIGNSEIGRRNLSARPSLFRAICMNGCIWDQTKGSTYRKIHRGNSIDLMALRHELSTHLNKQIPLVTGVIDRLMASREFGWDGAGARPVFAAVGQRFRLTKKVNTEILQAWRVQANEEPAFSGDGNPLRRTAFAVINAVTRSSQDSTTTPESWVQRDELGGKLLNMDRNAWAGIVSTAKSLAKEDVVASFNATVFSAN